MVHRAMAIVKNLQVGSWEIIEAIHGKTEVAGIQEGSCSRKAIQLHGEDRLKDHLDVHQRGQALDIAPAPLADKPGGLGIFGMEIREGEIVDQTKGAWAICSWSPIRRNHAVSNQCKMQLIKKNKNWKRIQRRRLERTNHWDVIGGPAAREPKLGKGSTTAQDYIIISTVLHDFKLFIPEKFSRPFGLVQQDLKTDNPDTKEEQDYSFIKVEDIKWNTQRNKEGTLKQLATTYLTILSSLSSHQWEAVLLSILVFGMLGTALELGRDVVSKTVQGLTAPKIQAFLHNDYNQSTIILRHME
ncbi:hypothetical protein PPACK8108_LOCUS21160 [Phakopsora pachyrhizi]|uniref:ABC transmembrane type-1 domain-containing protein n=1 Tax=Phakopsora pachyrhizi TaxID=170000 RepID=A0AAV0BIV5_PHAPC|nr:hypothetical protein PPACK8108_LOCUS21160 [Phakopsora pachyrhizi]